jgi:hypothetical protein
MLRHPEEFIRAHGFPKKQCPWGLTVWEVTAIVKCWRL